MKEKSLTEIRKEIEAKSFAQEYLACNLDAEKAAINLGCNPFKAFAYASRMLSRKDVIKAIAEEQRSLEERTRITQEKVLNQLAKLAFFNPKNALNDDYSLKDDTQDLSMFTLKFKRTRDRKNGDGTTAKMMLDEIHYDAAHQQNALNLLGRHLGFFEKDNKRTFEMRIQDIFSALPPEMVSKLITKISTLLERRGITTGDRELLMESNGKNSYSMHSSDYREGEN